MSQLLDEAFAVVILLLLLDHLVRVYSLTGPVYQRAPFLAVRKPHQLVQLVSQVPA